MRDYLRAATPEKLLLLAGARVLHADQKAAAKAAK